MGKFIKIRKGGILMSKRIISIVLSIVMIMSMTSTMTFAQVTSVKAPPSFEQYLSDWVISPSVSGTTCGLPGGSDEAILASNYSTAEWIPAKVPSSILGNLLDAGVYDAFFMDRNGTTDEWFNRQFTAIPSSDFTSPWWYNTSFTLPADQAGKRVIITFKGISHVAEIYVNGVKMVNEYTNIVDHSFLQNGPPIQENYTDLTTTGNGHAAKYGTGGLNDGRTQFIEKDFIGTFRTFNVDITDALNATGTPNNIKIKVTRPGTGSQDLTYHWVDWHPRPVDNIMGLTSEVILSTSGIVRLDNPAVATKVAADLNTASVSLFCDATNLSAAAVTGTATAMLKNPAGETVATVSKDVTIPAKKYNFEIMFRPADFSSLNLANPQLWWPYLSGDQPLYTVDWSFSVGGNVSDAVKHRAGLRELRYDINVTPLGNQNRAAVASNSGAHMFQLYVNHKPVLLKGGGYCPTDLFLRHDPVQNQGVIDNMKYMGMNFFRDEGKFYDNDLLDLCDENGILVMTGWCCCDRNQQPGSWSMSERFLAYEAQFSQLKNLRGHSAALLWFNGSDEPPSFTANNATGRMVEEQYIRVAALCRWDEIGAIATSACLDASSLLAVTGYGNINTGFHMDSSYDNQSPTHMFNPATVGSSGTGPFGFIGEGLGGANIPPIESMKKFIPEANLWPYNSSTTTNYAAWNLHNTTSGFTTLAPLNTIAENAYGKSTTLESWHAKASAAQYDQYKAQYEALNYFRFKNTSGFVNWMLNNARPGLYWQQFDYYMNPTSATFGMAKANEPVHIMYNLYDHDVSVINSTFKDYGAMTAEMAIYNLDGELISKPMQKTVNVEPDGVGETVDYGTGTSARFPTRFASHYNEATGTFSNVDYMYNGKINEAYGVNTLWKYDDIEAALTEATSDVYFIRLQLKDNSGKVVSYNSYAIGMRTDISTTTSWNRGAPIALSDFSALNSLPALSADELKCVQTEAAIVGENVVQTLKITNNSDSIAHNVYLASYKDSTCADLIGAVQYTDNMFILFPGETRTIDVTHRLANLEAEAFITVTCYNNQIGGDKPVRFKNVYTGQGLGRGRSLSIGRPVTGSGGGTPANLTTVSNANITAATNHKTFIDCATNSVYTPTLSNQSAWFYVDLGSSKPFDKIIMRFNGSNNIRGRADTVVLAGTNDTSGEWTDIGTYTNPGGSIAMDIVLDKTETYRYVRATCTTASGSLNVSGMDIYAFSNYVDVNVVGDGIVTSDGKIIDRNTYANQCVLAVEPGAGIPLVFTPANSTDGVLLLINGEIAATQPKRSDNAYSLTLDNINEDIEITAMFVEGDSADYTVSAVVEDKNAILIVAVYDPNSGKLEAVKSKTSNIDAPKWRQISIKWDELGDELADKEIKAFVWDSVTYIPTENKAISVAIVPAIKFLGLTANGSADASTSELTITLDKVVPGLSENDITISGAGIEKNGPLGGSGPVYSMPVLVTQAGTITVSIAKSDFIFNPNSLQTDVFVRKVAFTGLTANGDANTATTELTITLDKAVSGLTADDFSVSGATISGPLGGSGPVYTLPVAVTQNGAVTVALSKSGIDFVPTSLQATVFAKKVTIVSVSANGDANVTTDQLTITLDQVVPGLSAEDIDLQSDTVVKGALSGTGPVYTLAVTVSAAGMVNVGISKAGYEVTPDKMSVNVNCVGPEYTYPVDVDLYMGVSATSVNANPIAHAETSGRVRWYVNSWTGDAQQIPTSHAGCPTRARFNAARYLVVEYPSAPPAGRIFVLSLHADGNWGHTYANTSSLPDEHKVVVTADGKSNRIVFDLGTPYTKASQGASSAFSTSSTSYGLTVNVSSGIGMAATKAWLANSRT